jgi:hypothetical protein
MVHDEIDLFSRCERYDLLTEVDERLGSNNIFSVTTNQAEVEVIY